MENMKAASGEVPGRPLVELKDWLERTQTKQEALARFLGVSQALISLYINGKRSLELKLVVDLAMLTGIPVEKLLTGDDAAAILKVLGKRATPAPRKTRKNRNVA